MTKIASFSRRSFLVMPLAFMACRPGEDLFELSGRTMGTTYNVVARDPSRSVGEAAVKQAITAALTDVNAKMSNWDASSEISRFNALSGSDTVSVSAELDEVMQAAEAVNRASAGRFDTTMGPLIEAWGFGAPGATPLPDQAAIDLARARSGHANTLRVGAGTLAKTQGDAQVYLAAIGKGYGADRIARNLSALGLTDYFVEIGGDLYASGTNAHGQPWQIGIETPDPLDRNVLDVVGVSGMGLASSGDYRNYFEQDGQRFSHVIDPVTGRPITHTTASATVLAENAMLADAWATAMLTLGRDRGLEVAQDQGIAVLFIERDGTGADATFKSVANDRFQALTA